MKLNFYLGIFLCIHCLKFHDDTITGHVCVSEREFARVCMGLRFCEFICERVRTSAQDYWHLLGLACICECACGSGVHACASPCVGGRVSGYE